MKHANAMPRLTAEERKKETIKTERQRDRQRKRERGGGGRERYIYIVDF